jgi:hypothetical protein
MKKQGCWDGFHVIAQEILARQEPSRPSIASHRIFQLCDFNFQGTIQTTGDV